MVYLKPTKFGSSLNLNNVKTEANDSKEERKKTNKITVYMLLFKKHSSTLYGSSNTHEFLHPNNNIPPNKTKKNDNFKQKRNFEDTK